MALRVVVAAPPFAGAPADLARLPACADLVELRLDLLPGGLDPSRLADWLAASPRPVLATVRSAAEGGAFWGSPEEAARILQGAARAGAAWVDAEAPVLARLRDLPPTTKVLASMHGERAVDLPRHAGGRAVDAWKVARPVSTAASMAALCSEAREAGADPDSPPISWVPYGPLGAWRAAFARTSLFLYGSAGDRAEVVPGQPPLRALLDELRAGEVTPAADLYALLGAPPAWSPSPAIHNAVFRSLGLDAAYLPLPGVDPAAALALPFRGFSVTTPFKERAVPLVDETSPEVPAIGALNTIVRTPQGSWRGSNTDALAVEALVSPAPSGASALVFGAGGFARAAAWALRRRGYRVFLHARDEAKGRRAAEALHAEWSPEIRRRGTDAVFVNATPLGAAGPLRDHPLDGLAVVDAPYAVAGDGGTFAEFARGAARDVVDGSVLLLTQAVGQAKAFTGRDPHPLVLEAALGPRSNLVLLGPRGSGKTTVGLLVARRLGRPFVDTDDEVERITGRPAGRWIREEGIAAFRDAEARAIERLAGRKGLVIATGGGALERPESARVLAEGGFGVWLRVSAETAVARTRRDRTDRPSLGGTSPLEEARDLARRREHAWRTFARAVVGAEDPPEVVAGAVLEAWLPELVATSSFLAGPPSVE